MHERWCEAGFPPEDFWCQTARTIRSALTGYAERVKKAAILAGAKFNGVSTLPEPRPQTPDQMHAHLQALADKGFLKVRLIEK